MDWSIFGWVVVSGKDPSLNDIFFNYNLGCGYDTAGSRSLLPFEFSCKTILSYLSTKVDGNNSNFLH